MRKKTVIIVAGIALLPAIVIIIAWTQAGSRYNGKTLSELVRVAAYRESGRYSVGISDREVSEALDALRAIGPEADRFLIKTLQTKDTAWRTNYQSLYYSSIGRPFRRYLPPPNPAVALRQMATRAIGKIGHVSPQIERALADACQDSDVMVRAQAAIILGYKGSSATETVHAFQLAMSDPQVKQVVERGPSYPGRDFDMKAKRVSKIIEGLHRPFWQARYDAARALREIGAKAAPAVPELIGTLSDTNQMVRIACIRALASIGPHASKALPQLQKLESESSALTRSAAQEAIQQIQTSSSQSSL